MKENEIENEQEQLILFESIILKIDSILLNIDKKETDTISQIRWIKKDVLKNIKYLKTKSSSKSNINPKLYNNITNFKKALSELINKGLDDLDIDLKKLELFKIIESKPVLEESKNISKNKPFKEQYSSILHRENHLNSFEEKLELDSKILKNQLINKLIKSESESNLSEDVESILNVDTGSESFDKSAFRKNVNKGIKKLKRIEKLIQKL